MIEPSIQPGLFDARMNCNNNSSSPSWTKLKTGAITTLWSLLFDVPGNIERVKITVTYKPKDLK